MKSNLSALFDNAKKVALVSVPEKKESKNEPIQQEEGEEEDEKLTEKEKKKIK